MANNIMKYKIKYTDKDGEVLWMSYYRTFTNHEGVESHAFLFDESKKNGRAFTKNMGMLAAKALHDSIMDTDNFKLNEFTIEVVGPGFKEKVGA